MTKRTSRRLPALLMALCLLVSLAAPAAYAAQAEAAVLTISDEEDFRAFAKNCALDTWSQGRTVRLTADLDLMGAEFTPIPTFGGTFLGQGHTISGLRITGPGSVQGLFRYVQPSGVVQDLSVQGTVAPGGTRSTVGGVVGDNSGLLQNCAFRGAVQGKSSVGGIAGRNSATGQIIQCAMAGRVSGESATGGIAGRNLGLLMKCENSAGVNLTQTGSDLDLMNAGAGDALAEMASAGDETYHLLNGCSDTGGVVGWSSGVVQSCANTGAVGYPHVGYNTGGVAGRQSGYLAGCVNSGAVNGRKDVGGIVGQGEPYLVIDPSGDSLERLRGELDALDSLIGRALNNAQHTSTDVATRLEAMGGFTDNARKSSQNMLDRISDFTDGNIGAVNTVTADLTNLLDKIGPALDDLSTVGKRLEDLSGQLKRAMDSLGLAADTGDLAMRGLQTAADHLQRAGKELNRAAEAMGDALKELLKALPNAEKDPDQATGALKQVGDSAVELVSAVKDASAASDELRAVVEEDGDSFSSLGSLPDLPEMPGLSGLPEFNWDDVDWDTLKTDLEAVREALEPAGEALTDALQSLDQALKSAAPISNQLKAALEQFKGASDSTGSIGTLASRAFDTLSRALKDFTAKGPAQLSPLGEGFRQDSDGLFSALSGLSGEMDGLNQAVQNGSDALVSDLRAISSQFQTVFTVLLDALSDVKDLPETAVFEDTSEEDIAATRDGKVADCRNTGTVEGDRNVGGVIGAMAIEFDLDPEDDVTGAFSFGTTYETKAVLQNCINLGGVSAKKDCAGGLAGRMDLGTALDSQNYGPVESTGGDYVGGTVGYADASVRDCWAKSALSGKNYVGGVAGWASRLQDCRAIATITGGIECLGAIAGGVETEGVLSGCCFVDTGTAGVDGVSYAGRAEPVPFEAMAALENAPAEFTAFTLTLMADGKTVAQIPFVYGEDLSRIPLPDVPDQEGNYGVWPEFNVSGTNSDIILEAEYAPWVTLVASQEQQEQLSLALAEGQFTDKAILNVTDSTQTPPKKDVEGAVTWDVSLTGSDLGQGAPLPLRLLSPGGGDADVWQYKDGQWVAVDVQRNGQYLLLTMEGTQGTFFLQPQEDGPWLVILPIAAGAAALVVLLVVVNKVRRKKKKAVPAK